VIISEIFDYRWQSKTSRLCKNEPSQSKMHSRRFSKIIWLRKNESGNVESALVLIPLMILFLSVLQIAASAMGRTIGANFAQSQISRTSLYSDSQSLGPINSPSSVVDSRSSRIPLPGGGSILTLSQVHKVPLLTPLLASNDKFNVTGIVVDENS
jgi:hypothetical protein